MHLISSINETSLKLIFQDIIPSNSNNKKRQYQYHNGQNGDQFGPFLNEKSK